MQLYAEWLEERVDRPLNQVVFQVLFFYASMFGMDLSQLGGIPAGAPTT
jgi:hypothetical protein